MAIRLAIYGAAGLRYDPFEAGIALTFLYEWRKDALAYAALCAIRLGAGAWAQMQSRASSGTSVAAPNPHLDRIEVRDGARRMFLAPADIVSIEAAGNYVEIAAGGRTHLVRGALAGFEVRLAPFGIVRVHRSRLVNRSHVREIRPTGGGDVELDLSDGRTVAGSRRYRAALSGEPRVGL